jgi:hypothetical protein
MKYEDVYKMTSMRTPKTETQLITSGKTAGDAVKH